MKRGGERMRVILIILFFVNFSLAHDYWLQPNRFIISRGDTLIVHLYVGDKLLREIEREFQKDMTLKFEILTDSKSFNLLNEIQDKMLPVLKKKVDFEGLALIVMERDFAYIKLNQKEFSEYLKHEELDEVEKLRKKLPVREFEREKYRRYIKSLIMVGSDPDGEVYKKILGQKLEIVLLSNPYRLKSSDSIEAQVLFEGRPLVNKVVMAYNVYDGKFFEYKARTDENGKVKFQVKNPGLWLIRLVHLLPCENCQDVDWESFWASFSFEIPISP